MHDPRQPRHRAGSRGDLDRATTGCRRGEICKIVAADIGKDKIRIQAGNTKTLRYREVPIVPALRPWLKHLPLKIDVVKA